MYLQICKTSFDPIDQLLGFDMNFIPTKHMSRKSRNRSQKRQNRNSVMKCIAKRMNLSGRREERIEVISSSRKELN